MVPLKCNCTCDDSCSNYFIFYIITIMENQSIMQEGILFKNKAALKFM